MTMVPRKQFWSLDLKLKVTLSNQKEFKPSLPSHEPSAICRVDTMTKEKQSSMQERATSSSISSAFLASQGAH